MAERRIGGDVPGLSEMSDQEVQGRLQSTEEAIMLVCRACNRQVSRSTEAAAHDCGLPHRAFSSIVVDLLPGVFDFQQVLSHILKYETTL